MYVEVPVVVNSLGTVLIFLVIGYIALVGSFGVLVGWLHRAGSRS